MSGPADPIPPVDPPTPLPPDPVPPVNPDPIDPVPPDPLAPTPTDPSGPPPEPTQAELARVPDDERIERAATLDPTVPAEP